MKMLILRWLKRHGWVKCAHENAIVQTAPHWCSVDCPDCGFHDSGLLYD